MQYEYKIPNLRPVYYAITLIVLVAAILISITLYTEYLWFESVGYEGVFIKSIQYSIGFYLMFWAIFFVILFTNNVVVRKATEEFLGEPFRLPHLIDFLVSAFFAVTVIPYWQELLYFINAAEFGIKDPIFDIDASFYVFKLPFLKLVAEGVIVALLLACFISLIIYAYVFRWVRSFEEFKEIFPQLGFTHLGAIVALVLIASGFLIYLQRFELVYSQHGLLSGASYVDVNIKAPALLVVSGLAILCGVISFYFIRKRDVELFAYVVIIFLLGYILLAILIPFAVQKLQVEPSELAYEGKYLGYSINYTLYAYGLDNVKKIPFNYTTYLSIDEIESNRATINNVRIWDHRPINDVFKQLQQIRTYYVVKDVDVDRYHINDSYVQLMIAAREISTDLLPVKAQTWLNKHLIYTHGYGVVAAPVNSISKEGLPDLVIYDIPPQGKIKIDRPEIYYGEVTVDYVVVNTTQEEFDYPVGDVNYFTKYMGDGGVKLDYMRKLLYSIRFGDINLILSGYIHDGSRLMMHRNIVERVRTIAPFLYYDRDPYVAVINGKIYWIIDAYSKLDGFPYSAKVGLHNYMRNPVKVFVDAYNGKVTFYVVQEDALVRTLKNAFPELFTYEIDEEFRKHIRYPRDFFEVQAEIYATYHMSDVIAFYNREDVWYIPKEKFEDNIIDVEPYYVTLSLDEEPEFVLMLPFTPKDRDNLIAWMAARCDKNYGELLLYEFPKGELIYGPMQVDARIDQDAELSKLFTLWGQVGSKVIRGNLLVIPINNSLLYIEPVYLRAENAKIPELRGVIVVYDDVLKMGSNLDDALTKVFGEKVEEIVEEKPEAVTAEEKLEKIKDYYSKLIDALKSGRWTEFGEMLEKIAKELGISE
jgi:hypothetical protein